MDTFVLLFYYFLITVLVFCLLTWGRNTESFRNDTIYLDMPDYDVIEINNFLTHEECDEIIELSGDKLLPSTVYDHQKNVYNVETRKSQQCWLKDDIPEVKRISDRIKNTTNTHTKYIEDLQVVNYSPSGFFNPHYDACEGDESYCKRLNKNGPRYLTVLIYLNDDFTGGETVFPAINKSVKPEKGKAVIFQNVDGNGVIIEQAVHAGEPVKSGQKWIANKWIHLY
ncbi:MAG: 2OG-Fe(II) oxygenase [Proteobacteria bacterium]|nr:2OG-Fe(II) oxygenase [Pseudomonadota bacterium]NBP13751.1 2OG-Fe(II) oxygenase [bacterium]